MHLHIIVTSAQCALSIQKLVINIFEIILKKKPIYCKSDTKLTFVSLV